MKQKIENIETKRQREGQEERGKREREIDRERKRKEGGTEGCIGREKERDGEIGR